VGRLAQSSCGASLGGTPIFVGATLPDPAGPISQPLGLRCLVAPAGLSGLVALNGRLDVAGGLAARVVGALLCSAVLHGLFSCDLARAAGGIGLLALRAPLGLDR